jgi:hypothetical protein
MSVADTLFDAVAELDAYIAEVANGVDGWGEASPRGPHFAELLDVRDRMNKLRERIDGLYADLR